MKMMLDVLQKWMPIIVECYVSQLLDDCLGLIGDEEARKSEHVYLKVKGGMLRELLDSRRLLPVLS